MSFLENKSTKSISSSLGKSKIISIIENETKKKGLQ